MKSKKEKKKKVGKNLHTEKKQSYRHRTQTYSYQGIKGGRIKWKTGLGTNTLPYIKQVTNKETLPTVSKRKTRA